MSRAPPDNFTGRSVCTKALRIDGMSVRPDLMAKGAHVGDGGVLPDAREGESLVFRGGRWVAQRAPAPEASATPAPPSSPAWVAADWAGRPPADLNEAVLRLTHRMAASHGPIP